ncbi:hypothetical protein B0H16DRAFT_1555157 [Mycena metata]|uniref:Secreted protein n=1 Tax=Mycena metata TaxID=1033252 RepID=A0AAD7IP59_9AGAR|nr:hypothetical protein B0H16DRAFT_1555157 [Mycena metata]
MHARAVAVRLLRHFVLFLSVTGAGGQDRVGGRLYMFMCASRWRASHACVVGRRFRLPAISASNNIHPSPRSALASTERRNPDPLNSITQIRLDQSQHSNIPQNVIFLFRV